MAPESIPETLVQGPRRIAAATCGRSDAELGRRPDPEGWSVLEVLAHLHCCADVWGDQRIARMLVENEPTMKAVSPRSWILKTNYGELPFTTSFDVFAEQRQSLLHRLRMLAPGDWQKGALFTGFGTPRQFTVQNEPDALARHEQSHVKQIERRPALLRTDR